MTRSKKITTAAVLVVIICGAAALYVFNPGGIIDPGRQEFKNAGITNTIEEWQAFIEEFSGTRYAEQAQKNLAGLHLEKMWLAAQTADEPGNYKQFLVDFPDSGYVSFAMDRINAIYKENWEKAYQINTVNAYKVFIKKYPQADQVLQAQAVIQQLQEEQWEALREKDSLTDYRGYLSSGPEEKWAMMVQNRIDELIKKFGTLKDPEYFFMPASPTASNGASFYRFVVSSSDGKALSVLDNAPFYKFPRSLFGGPTMRMVMEYGNEWLVQGKNVPIQKRIFSSDSDYPLLLKVTLKGFINVGGRGQVRSEKGSVRKLGANHTVKRFLVQVNSSLPGEMHTAIWGLAHLAKSSEDKKSSASAIAGTLGKGPVYLDICRAEALYKLAQPVSLERLQQHVAKLKNRPLEKNSGNEKLSEAILNSTSQVVSPKDNYGHGKAPWYTKYLAAALTRVAQASPPYAWPPENADSLAPKDPQFRRIYVPLDFPRTISTQASLSIVASGQQVKMMTERPGDSLPMQIGMMMGGGGAQIPVGNGSEVRFGGSVDNGEIRIIVPDGRLAFKKTDMGWVYLCGQGSIEYGENKSYRFGDGRNVDNCLARLADSDGLLREAAVRELLRVEIPEDRKSQVIQALSERGTETSEKVRTEIAVVLEQFKKTDSLK